VSVTPYPEPSGAALGGARGPVLYLLDVLAGCLARNICFGPFIAPYCECLVPGGADDRELYCEANFRRTEDRGARIVQFVLVPGRIQKRLFRPWGPLATVDHAEDGSSGDSLVRPSAVSSIHKADYIRQITAFRCSGQ
jgi:hypothetical protein